MLRMHINAADEIGEAARGLLKSGRLVSDDVVNRLVEERIAAPDCRSGIILDGYPRTVNQAAVLLEMMAQKDFQPAVIHLVVDCDEIVARLSGRRQCPVCGTLYSLTTHPPKVSGVCDLDGAALITREDDLEAVIRERLHEYEQQTRPLLNYFRDMAVPVFEIEAARISPAQIMRQICRTLASSGFVSESVAAGEASAPSGGIAR